MQQTIFNPIEIKGNLILVVLRNLDDGRFDKLISSLIDFLETIRYLTNESASEAFSTLFDLMNVNRDLLALRHHLAEDIQQILEAEIPWINRPSAS
jgi:hypothetical protein